MISPVIKVFHNRTTTKKEAKTQTTQAKHETKNQFHTIREVLQVSLMLFLYMFKNNITLKIIIKLVIYYY